MKNDIKNIISKYMQYNTNTIQMFKLKVIFMIKNGNKGSVGINHKCNTVQCTVYTVQ